MPTKFDLFFKGLLNENNVDPSNANEIVDTTWGHGLEEYANAMKETDEISSDYVNQN